MDRNEYPELQLKDGRHVHTAAVDHGPTVYTVTIQFSDDYMERDPENGSDNPWHWGWSGLLDQIDARVITVQEEENPWWIQ